MKITRTTQPQVPVGIDWSNPITRGLSIAVIPNGNSARELTLSTLSAKVGSPSTSIGQRGVASVGSDGTNYFSFTDYDKYDLVGPITVIAVVDGISGGVSGCYLSKGPIDTANTPFFFGRKGSIISLSRGGSSDYQRFNTTNTVMVPNAPCVLGVTQNGVLGSGATCNYYLNGTTPGSSAGGSMANTVAAANALPVRFAGTVEKVYLSFAFNRVLSDAEIRSLSANPWQIFQPIEKKVFIGTSVAVEGQIYNLDYTDLSYLVDLPDTEVATSLDIVEPSSTAETVDNALQFNSDSTDPQSSTDTTSSILETVVDATDNLVYTDSLELNITVQIAQTLIPIGEISNTGWTGTYADIDDETTTEYITTNTIGSIAEYNLTSGLDPYSNIGHLPSIMLSADAGGIIIRLKQGATVIKSWTYNTLPSTPTLYSPTLTTTEVGSITDYTDLRISFESTP